MQKPILSILLVIAVGWLAYMLSREPSSPGRENLIQISASQMIVEPVLETSSTSTIEDYIKERFGVSVEIPMVRGAEITGIGVYDVDDDVHIPTLLLNDPNGDVQRIFVFTYSLLDTWARSVFLERAVRVDLEQSNQFAVIGADGDREAVLWRSGDDIFLAVAERGAGDLIRRLDGRAN